MNKITRNVILRNAFTAGQLAITDGVLTLAGTPISIIWKKLKGYKAETYTAGSFGRITINLNGITAVNNGGHRLVIKNSNRSALQTELVVIVYGDSTSTASEIAAEIARKVQDQSGPNSVFKFVSFNSGTNVLIVDLEDTSYSTPSIDTDIVGVVTTVSAPVKPVGASDAEGLAGYNVSAQYDKYTFHEEGTIRDGNNDVPVLYEDIVYMDDSVTAFATAVDDVVDMQGVANTVDIIPYLQVPSL